MTKYNAKVVERICEGIAAGLRQADAAEYAGINPDTFYEWKKGRPDFTERLQRAELWGKKANLDIINEAKRADWRAAAWLLQRRHPAEFALRVDMKVKGDIQTKPSPVLEGLDQKKLEALNAKLDRFLRGQEKKHA